MDNSNRPDCLFEKNSMLIFTNENGVAKVKFQMTSDEFDQCPSCHGLMYYEFAKDGYRFTAPCAAARTERRMARFNAANIPAKFRNASFESFDLNSLKGIGQSIDALFIKSIREFKLGQRGVLLEGGPGTGKTHLMCAAARYLALELNVSVRYVDFSMLLSRIRSIYQQPNASQSEAELINDIVSVPVLFLDELGKGRDKTNDFEMRIIDEIINTRYNNDDLTTYFASNYRDRNTSGYTLFANNCINDCGCSRWMEFAARKCGSNKQAIDRFTQSALSIMNSDHLEDRLEPRIVSRIFEMANPLYLESVSDHRTKK